MEIYSYQLRSRRNGTLLTVPPGNPNLPTWTSPDAALAAAKALANGDGMPESVRYFFQSMDAEITLWVGRQLPHTMGGGITWTLFEPR